MSNILESNKGQPVSEKIFEFAYSMALRDATLQLAYYDEKKENNKKHLLECEPARDEVKKYIDCILNRQGVPDFYRTEKTVEEAFDKYLGNDYPTFTFGNAQKLINMTAKYMFISCYYDESLRNSFKDCHCPMDSKMIEIIIKKTVEGGFEEEVTKIFREKPNSSRQNKTWRAYLRQSWSKITNDDKDQYVFFQRIVKLLGEKELLCPLEFDYCYWE